MLTHFIDCWDAFEDFKRYVQDNEFEYVVLDTETNSVIERKALLWGLGVCFEDNEGFYFPIRDKDGNKVWTEDQERAIAKYIAELCITHKLIGHNIIYDVLVIKNNWGYDLTDHIYADTILMKHLVDEERPFGLKEVAVKYIGPGADLAQKELYESIKTNGGKTTKENMEMFRADTTILGKYCSWDVMLTKKLYDIFSKRIKEENTEQLFFEEVMPLYKLVTIPMKDRGFPINIEHFKRLDNEITREIKAVNDSVITEINGEIKPFCDLLLNENYPIKTSGTYPKILADVLKLPLPRTPEGNVTLAKKKIEELAKHNTHAFYNWLLGNSEFTDHEHLYRAQIEWYFKDNPDALHVFNLKSNNHLKWLFFEQLSETPISKTDSGEPQVDEDFLESVKKSHVWVKDLLDFKKMIKLKGTYIEGVLDRQIDGVIYASMLQWGTSSGRYSSTNPNLQNLPRPKGEDSDLSPRVLKYVNAIREGFVAPPGYKLVDADQSALEPRCLWEYTRVLTSSGYKYIKDVRVGDKVLTKFGFKNVINKWDSIKESVHILTNTGELYVSKEHQIWSKTRQMWVEAGDLQEGEELEEVVAENKGQEITRLPIYSVSALDMEKKSPLGFMTLTEDVAWALGAFLGDGVCGMTKRLEKSKKVNGGGIQGYVGICGLTADNVTPAFESIFNGYGYFFSSTPDKRSKSGEFKHVVYRGKDLLNLFVNTFEVMELTDYKSKRLHIPNYILNASNNIKLSFLAGLIDTDGTTGSRYEGGTDLVITTCSSQFANDIIVLLNSMGLSGRITYTLKNNSHFGCQVRVINDSKNKLIELGINDKLVCKRKKISAGLRGSHSKGCTIKKILKGDEIKMCDISVEDVNEFVAENIRVHNCFASASGDSDLQAIFHQNMDMYSAIGIKSFGITDSSPFKKDANFFGKLHPEKRQSVKSYCFVADTKIPTKDGIKNIQDLKVGDMVKTKYGFRSVTNILQREAETIKFVTNRFGLVCTPDHKIWNQTRKCFIQADEFIPGDLVEIEENILFNEEIQYLPVYTLASYKNGFNLPFSNLPFNEDWGYLLGAFLGDGIASYTNRKNIKKAGFNSHHVSGYIGICGLPEDSVIKHFETLLGKYGWAGSTVLTTIGRNKPVASFRVANTDLVSLFQNTFKAFDFNSERARKNLKIQDFVFNSPLEVKLAFIAGLLDTDGYLKYNKTKGCAEVAFCSKSFELASDFCYLLKGLGVDSTLKAEYNKTYDRHYFLVNVLTKGIDKLVELGAGKYLVCPRKKEALSVKRTRNTNRGSKMKSPAFQLSLPADARRVYDITVDEVHEFYANGGRVHNCLAVTYGAEANRIAGLLGIEREEAQKLIDDYLKAFPGLKKYIKSCHDSAKKNGYVKNAFGRMRHLPRVQELYRKYGDKLLDARWAKMNGLSEERYQYKNGLNNSTNFPIQSLAAHIINRSAIAISKAFKEQNIDGYIALNVHDQLICIVKEEQAEQAKDIVRDCMQNTVKIDVPLVAEPTIADNMKESH